MKTQGDKKKLVTLRVGAATPNFLTQKSKENVYYLGLSSAQGKTVGLEMKGNYAETLHVASASDGRESLELPLSEEEEVWSAKISPDGSRVFLNGKVPRLIDAASGRILHIFKDPKSEPGSQPSHLWSATFSQDGKRLALAWEDAEVWDVPNLRPIKLVPEGDSQCTSLLLSADGKLLVCGSRDAGIYIRDVATGGVIKSFEREFVAGHVNTASLAFPADGKLIAAGPGQRAVFKRRCRPRNRHPCLGYGQRKAPLRSPWSRGQCLCFGIYS